MCGLVSQGAHRPKIRALEADEVDPKKIGEKQQRQENPQQPIHLRALLVRPEHRHPPTLERKRKALDGYSYFCADYCL